MSTVKFSEVNFTDSARELAELFLTTTDYRVMYANWTHSRQVEYLHITDGENIITVGKDRNTFRPWYATFPIKPSREFGSGIVLPTDSTEEIWTAAEVVDVVRRYMGPTLTPGPRHYEGAYGLKSFANHHANPTRVEMVEIVADA